ncbi:MAG: DUF3853 family protein [Bacteroides sp.]|nr:DUF3853 family protein [Bacteroides sp.]MCM1531429.1 DUF3853 family protein [Ruminococcus flavefaciens]MCM1554409.1 DUF3853 family protein [Bacteroides sp.]
MTALMDNIQNIDVKELLKKPLWQMTGEEFLALSNAAKNVPQSNNGCYKETATALYEEGKYAFGIQGLCDLFNISSDTAIRYKKTFLQPAIIQRGRKIIIDKEKAIKLFNSRK